MGAAEASLALPWRHGPHRADAAGPRPAPTARVLIETVLGQHGFSIADIGDHKTHLEHRRRAHARDEAVYVATIAHPGLPLATIAELFRRDVGTIIRGQQAFRRRLLEDRPLAARVFNLVKIASGGRP